MNCADIRKYVFVFLDGEFEPSEQREFEVHISDCSSCRSTVKSEQQFQHDFKNKLKPLSAPSYLREQIVAQLEKESSEQPITSPSEPVALLSWPWRFAPVALAAALVGVLFWPDNSQINGIAPQDIAGSAPIYSSPQSLSYSAIPASLSGASRPVRNTLASYQQLKADVPAQQVHNEMRHWVSFKAQAPVANSSEMKLVGARRVQYQGQKAVLFIYRYKNERISVLQYRGTGGGDEASLQLERNGTMTTGRLRRFGNSYWVITELDSETLSRLLASRN